MNKAWGLPTIYSSHLLPPHQPHAPCKIHSFQNGSVPELAEIQSQITNKGCPKINPEDKPAQDGLLHPLENLGETAHHAC